MGYTHGTIWNEAMILQHLKIIVKKTNQKTLPTTSEMNKFYGDFKLSNAVRRSGKSRKEFADLLGLELKQCESTDGFNYETKCKIDLMELLGLESELAPTRYPYDLLVEKTLKVDVKHSNLVGSEKNYFSCNLEKNMQTCDIFIVYCTGHDKENVYIIPAHKVSGQKQLAIGAKNSSKYEKYFNNWNLVYKYLNAVQSLN